MTMVIIEKWTAELHLRCAHPCCPPH